MWTVQDFRVQQQTYFSAVNRAPNRSLLLIERQAIEAAGGGLAEFLGESSAPREALSFRCLYQRQFSVDQRTRMGLDPEVIGVVTIPALEVKRVLGVEEFPQSTGLTVTLLRDKFDIAKVVGWEPFLFGEESLCLGWELRLRQLADNQE